MKTNQLNFKKPVKNAVVSPKMPFNAPKQKKADNVPSKLDKPFVEAKIDLSDYRKTGEYTHEIGFATKAFAEMASSVENALIVEAFRKAPKGDHFYSGQIKYSNKRIKGYKFYISLSGSPKNDYVIMLPSDY